MINAASTRRRKIEFTVNNTNNVVIFTATHDCFISCQEKPGSLREGTVFFTATNGPTITIYTPGADSQGVFMIPAGTVVRCSENQSGWAFTGILHVLELD
jgi:hypothetical protein